MCNAVPYLAGDLIARNSQETLIGVAEQRMAAAEKHREKWVRSQLVNHFRRRLESNLSKDGTRNSLSDTDSAV